MRRNPFPRKKSKLPPLGKAIVAARVLLDVRDEKLDDKAAGALLREEVGLNWSVLTAAQYLTGKEAVGAVELLPADWSDEHLSKRGLIEAMCFANLACAQGHPRGSQLSAGLAVPAFRPDGEIGKLLREVQAQLDGSNLSEARAAKQATPAEPEDR
jgi:hypothetical protein